MTQVAQEFEISDRAIAKLCAKRQVPVPSRGYWARKKAGQNVPQLPLPAFTENPAKARKVRVEPAKGTAGKPKAHSLLEERNRTIKTALKGFRNALSEAIDYTVRIDGWNCDHSFGLNSPTIRCIGMTGCHCCMSRRFTNIVIWFCAAFFLRPRKCGTGNVRFASFAGRISTRRPLKKTCIAMRSRLQSALEAFQGKTMASWAFSLFPKTRLHLPIKMQRLRSNS